MSLTDKQVKDAIGEIWTSAASTLSEPVRVIPRWKLSLRGTEVVSSLRSLTNNKIINGVYITRIRAKKKKVGTNHWEYRWTYMMMYFRSYDDGTDANNSEDKANRLLEAVSEKFEITPDLGLDDVDNHDEMQIENIDTMDLKVHTAQCLLTVNITKQY